jgi:hypothetical protein
MTAGKIVEPCPFCGSAMKEYRERFYHENNAEDRCLIGQIGWPIEKLALWNTRTPEAATITSLTVEVERLKTALDEARTTISVASSVLYSAEAFQTSNLCDDTIDTIDAALAAIQPTDTE